MNTNARFEELVHKISAIQSLWDVLTSWVVNNPARLSSSGAAGLGFFAGGLGRSRSKSICSGFIGAPSSAFLDFLGSSKSSALFRFASLEIRFE